MVEFSYLPNLKLQLQGSRVVTCANFGDVLPFMKTTQPADKTFSYDEVIDFFSEAV